MDCGPSLPELAQTKRRYAALIAQVWCSATELLNIKELFENIWKLLRRRLIVNKFNKSSCTSWSLHIATHYWIGTSLSVQPASVDPSKYVNGATAGPLLPRDRELFEHLGSAPVTYFEHCLILNSRVEIKGQRVMFTHLVDLLNPFWSLMK